MVRNVFSDDLFFPSQPASTTCRSSQSQCGGGDGSEETVERAFWQSTPTELQELRKGTDREKEKEEWYREAAVSDQGFGQEDTLCLSTEQSRLIRQTWWTSTASHSSTMTVHPKGATPSSSLANPRRGHAGRGHGGGVGETMAMTSQTPNPPMMCPPDDSIFREMKNIEKVCMAVDDRIQQRKALKEWTTKVTSETARLRGDDDDSEDEDANLNSNSSSQLVRHIEVERSPSYRPRKVAEVDPQCSEDDYDGHPESTQEVPTSQSQERYLSLSSFSQDKPTGCFNAGRI